jgi:putative flippase GtrA
MLKPIIIIPAFRPNQKLIEVIENLSIFSDEYHQIILINDGSEFSYDPLFEQARNFPKIQILSHGTNLGKGQALKTGFNHILCHYADSTCGVVTCDADGQHLAQDIISLSKQLYRSPQTLWIGARNFNLPHIPFRSKFGNILTRKLFKWFVGLNLTDTQSGLRGIPIHFLPTLLKTQTIGYDFELDMLMLSKKNHIPLQEHPIQTIYEEKNKSSHFNPVIDSVKIYFVFFRYLAIALLSGVLDYSIFTASYFLSQNILLSELTARVISGTVNFGLNKKMVFQSSDKVLPEALRYLLLCLINLAVSYSLLTTLANLGTNVYFGKISVMAFLFVANFAIQKVLVFKPLQAA